MSRKRSGYRSDSLVPAYASRSPLSDWPAAYGGPQPNRRWWLAACAAGGAACVLRPHCLQASSAELRPLTFLVVSDTHLGYGGSDRAERQWEQTSAELAHAPGEVVLHLGDVVDRRREEQYAVYRKYRDRIGKPVHEVPGNHDPQPLFARHIRDPIDTVVELHWLRFVLLGNAHTDSHDGFLEDKQIRWLDEQCQSARKSGKYVIVCMHVPAHSNRHPDRGWYVKPGQGQRRLYALLERHASCVLALFHGHFHNGIRGWEDHGPLHEICFPSALYNQNRRLEAQQAPGYNLNEFRPGFTQVSIENGELWLRYKPVRAPVSLSRKQSLKQLS